MQRRTSAALLGISAAVALLSQLRPLPQDEGLLLSVSGRPVDALGQLHDAWQRLWRDCRAVQRPDPGSALWQEALQALADYSPPASRGARPQQLLAWGDGKAQWLLAEVRWDNPLAGQAATPAGRPLPALDPAVVPLARQAGVLQVQAAGVWSGDTGPWHAPVFIRRYLGQRLPGLPAPLLRCLDPQHVGGRP